MNSCLTSDCKRLALSKREYAQWKAHYFYFESGLLKSFCTWLGLYRQWKQNHVKNGSRELQVKLPFIYELYQFLLSWNRSHIIDYGSWLKFANIFGNILANSASTEVAMGDRISAWGLNWQLEGPSAAFAQQRPRADFFSQWGAEQAL